MSGDEQNSGFKLNEQEKDSNHLNLPFSPGHASFRNESQFKARNVPRVPSAAISTAQGTDASTTKNSPRVIDL